MSCKYWTQSVLNFFKDVVLVFNIHVIGGKPLIYKIHRALFLLKYALGMTVRIHKTMKIQKMPAAYYIISSLIKSKLYNKDLERDQHILVWRQYSYMGALCLVLVPVSHASLWDSEQFSDVLPDIASYMMYIQGYPSTTPSIYEFSKRKHTFLLKTLLCRYTHNQ